MTTIIKITIDGVPVDWAPAEYEIDAIRALVREAKAKGAQGQPLRSSFGGPGKPGRPPVPQPTVDAQGRLCCPYDGAPLRQKAALDGKWACDAKGPAHEHVNERGYCRYIIAPDAVTVEAKPATKPAVLAPNPALNAKESGFWSWLDGALGIQSDWPDVDRILGRKALAPKTVDEWNALYRQVRDALAQQKVA